jgi:hypothetical protein
MKYIPLYCLLLLLAASCNAQFDITAAGKIHPLTGDSQPINFGFSFVRQEGTYRFIAGSQSLNVHTVPKKYSIVLILQDEQQVWVPDFSQDPVSGFELDIENYQLRLFHDPAMIKARGNYVFQLNGENYYFNRGPAQINFYFTERGIKEVRVEGMFKPSK